jgi:predicted protein tyrosine phosphatase
MIIVSSLFAAPSLVELHKPSHVISLLSPDSQWPSFPSLQQGHHLRLSLNDIAAATPGLVAPSGNDAERLIKFVKGWDRKAPMLVHCWAGISRSTAAAYCTMCLLQENASESDLAWQLRELAPSATPNRLLVRHVDALLGREGRMTSAVEKIGRGEEAFEGTPFFWKVD